MHPRSACIRTIAVLALLVAGTSLADPLLTFPLKIRDHELRAEVANNDESRRRGLMFRKRMPENHGMVFVYVREERAGMWMRNTYIALSVAFIDSSGRILNIEDMEPLSDQSHFSAGEAKYALEMNRGWFAKRGIRRGDTVQGLERLPPAR